MKLKRLLLVAVIHAMVTVIALAQIAPFQERYIPPNIATDGKLEHFRYMAVIETECESPGEVEALTTELENNGAIVVMATSPKRLLAWIPPAAQAAAAGDRGAGDRPHGDAGGDGRDREVGAGSDWPAGQGGRGRCGGDAALAVDGQAADLWHAHRL